MKLRIAETSPLYALLGDMRLFNLQTGKDGITLDKDYKHVFKRLRNTLLRENGIVVDGCRVTPRALRRHLLDSGMTWSQVDSLLNPEDKQDVVLMYTLLRAIWSISDAPAGSLDSYKTVRSALKIYGRFCYFLVAPYVQIHLSLSEQLEYLSRAAHMALALFTHEKGHNDFIPAGLFLDIMHMVKNAFVCIAKTKVKDPDGLFWLILLGTDRLETAFGILRTIVGNDANADLLQLGTRLSHVVECANILARFPHWDKQPRRLRMAALTESGEIARNVDHITTVSWTGNVSVKTVVLQTSWELGRKFVEQEYVLRDFKARLTAIDNSAGADMLSPLGGALQRGDDDEDLENSSSEQDDSPPNSQAEDPDLEDVIGAQTCAPTVCPTIDVGDTHTKVYKARVLRQMIRHRAKDSVDRLRRVAKIPRYTGAQSDTVDDSSLLGAETLCVNDPVAVLVSCDDTVFLAIADVISLKRDSTSLHSIASTSLVDDGVDVRFQILRLRPLEPENGADWAWAQGYYDGSYWSPGRFVQPVNPAILVKSSSVATLAFKTDDLRGLAVAQFDQLAKSDSVQLAHVKRTDTFPYRWQGEMSNSRTSRLANMVQAKLALLVFEKDAIRQQTHVLNACALAVTHLWSWTGPTRSASSFTWLPIFSSIPSWPTSWSRVGFVCGPIRNVSFNCGKPKAAAVDSRWICASREAASASSSSATKLQASQSRTHRLQMFLSLVPSAQPALPQSGSTTWYLICAVYILIPQSITTRHSTLSQSQRSMAFGQHGTAGTRTDPSNQAQ